VCDRFEPARDEARRADAATIATPRDRLPLFHGVPCTIKESFALEGMPNSGGLVARRDHIATSDATAVARLRAAGCIPLGVTNVSELCMWMESSNRVYGRTANAYDAKRIAGGSSGGEGSIVGAGGVPFGLGADIGGSIRMPAFFNGVFGHKPTGGLVPGSGQYPLAENDALRYLTTGPIARRAEDLMPVLRVLAGPDGIDSRCEARVLGRVEDVDLSKVRVLDVGGNGRIGVSRDLRAAQKKAARALASRGARVEETRVEGFHRSAEIWAARMGTQETTSFRSRLEYGAPKHMGRELARWALGHSDHTLPAIALALVEGITKASPQQTARFVAMGLALKEEVANRIGDDGVMLFPSYPEVAPRHHAPLLVPVKWMYTAILNVLELPVTQVPLGLDARGLPLGIQVVGAHGRDHLTIAVAMELERQFGGWVVPTN
jgi:fatty acid amide hydrolase 2